MKIPIMCLAVSLFLLLFLASCGDNPETAEKESNEVEHIEEIIQAPLEVNVVGIFEVLLPMDQRAFVKWNSETNTWQEIIPADSPILEAARNILFAGNEEWVIVEQEDTSLITASLEDNHTESIYIEPVGDLAGPKQPDYNALTDTVVFTRIDDDQCKLYMISRNPVDGELPIELHVALTPVISPCFNLEGTHIFYGLYDAELSRTEIFDLETASATTVSLGFIAGELQKLDVSPGESTLVALSFLNQFGMVTALIAEEWKILIPEMKDIGETFALATTEPLLAIPIITESGKTLKVLDILKGRSKEFVLEIQADYLDLLQLKVQ